MASTNDINSSNTLSLPLQMNHTLLRLSRQSISITAYPLSPIWSLALAPTSGLFQRAPKRISTPRSLVLLALVMCMAFSFIFGLAVPDTSLNIIVALSCIN
ncbi:hypothetical protein EDB83DRAFT_726968 [Lactarius deliciosus]|nr:hypothetical protein EDB83DRAFT_726968 [Lactarius deliciosus]